MNLKKNETLQFVKRIVKENGGKYEEHSFDSGASIIDIWINENFIVVQFQEKQIGVSIIDNDNSDFSTIPDHTFDNAITFKKFFFEILKID